MKVVDVTRWNSAMSMERFIVNQGQKLPTPAWGHSEMVQALGESLEFQLRRFSLSNKPTVAMLPVWDEESAVAEPTVSAPSKSTGTFISLLGKPKRVIIR